ncbi:Spc24-domain-containing protein [Violaceomyces palustris]|uniref:Spc24-domain-containing protein n=1 Tax=Violaceomyces palustris TaxID=1673888 RepID=A0ACD0NYH2_9BASI|nr:Spc24-domain-containing protein [Violaceomyces palustris]
MHITEEISEEEWTTIYTDICDTLDPRNELERLRKIDQTIKEADARRRKETEEMEARIIALHQSLQELQRASSRQSADWKSSKSHVETMAKLDNQNFDLAKRLNEDESKLSALQTELNELKGEYEEVEGADVEDEVQMDKDAIALRLFRSLGFLPSQDPTPPSSTSDGNPIKTSNDLLNYTTILVRSDKRNAALPFEVTDEKISQLGISPFVLADQLWKASD